MQQSAAVPANPARFNLALTGSLYLLMMAYAISTTMIGPLMPSYLKTFQIDMAVGGLVTAMQGVGGVLSVLAGSLLLDRVRKLPVIAWSFLIYAASFMAISLLGSFGALVSLFFLIGASTKLMDAAINSSLADLHGEKRGLFVNLLHTFFGIGTLIGPVLSAWLIKSGGTPSLVFRVLSIFCLFVFIPFFLVLRRGSQSNNGKNPSKWVNPLVFLKDKRALFLSLAGFCYTALSIGQATWLPLYMQTNLQTDLMLASLPVTIFAVGLIIGRLTCSALASWPRLIDALTVSHVICAILWVLAFLINSPIFLLVMAGIAGFCVSGVVPVSVSISCGWYPNQTGGISSLIFLLVTLGSIVGPGLVGIIAQASSLRLAMILLGAWPFLAFIAFKLARASRGVTPSNH
jgi:fucose permease